MKLLSSISAAALLAALCSHAEAAPKRNNYVIFNFKGDCGQEDCIAATKEALSDLLPAIVSIDAASLAPHETVDYKILIVKFKDLKTAPYGPVMHKVAALGYQPISFVIHDTHTGQDVIIPHT